MLNFSFIFSLESSNSAIIFIKVETKQKPGHLKNLLRRQVECRIVYLRSHRAFVHPHFLGLIVHQYQGTKHRAYIPPHFLGLIVQLLICSLCVNCKTKQKNLADFFKTVCEFSKFSIFFCEYSKFSKFFVDFQNLKNLMKIEFCQRQIFENSIMYKPINFFGPIGSSVLTFSGYKQTNK